VYGTPVAPPTGLRNDTNRVHAERSGSNRWLSTFTQRKADFVAERFTLLGQWRCSDVIGAHSAFIRVPVLLLWRREKNMSIPVGGATGVPYARRSVDGILFAAASD